MNTQNQDFTDPDFIVSSLLAEQKAENARKDSIIHGLIKVIVGMFFLVGVIVAGFLWYLNQYDFSSSEVITASGVYALVDSAGNVVAQDLTDEQIMYIMEVLNSGDDTSGANTDEDQTQW